MDILFTFDVENDGVMKSRKVEHYVVGAIGITLVLGVVMLIGNKLQQLSESITNDYIEKVFIHRSNGIVEEFKKTEHLLQQVAEQFDRQSQWNGKTIKSVLEMSSFLDQKLSIGWVFPSFSDQYYVYDNKTKTSQDRGKDSLYSEERRVIVRELKDETIFPIRTSWVERNGEPFWRIRTQLSRGQDSVLTIGFDISLLDLHDYFSELTPVSESYVYILNGKGMIISHPNEIFVGHVVEMTPSAASDTLSSSFFEQQVNSRFLSMPVFRRYYPLEIGGEKLWVVVNVPSFVHTEKVERFHSYVFWITVLFVLLVLVVAWYFKIRWRNEEKLHRKIEVQAAELKLEQLKNQLNPHFLFNSLNSLHALIGVNDRLAQDFVIKLSKMYRYLLEHKDGVLTTVADEIEFMQHYYFLQQIRFGDSLQIHVDRSVRLVNNLYVPALSLQLLIENAIKHNLVSKENPLCINIEKHGNYLIVKNKFQPRIESSIASLGVGYKAIENTYSLISVYRFSYEVIDGWYICKLPLLNSQFDAEK